MRLFSYYGAKTTVAHLYPKPRHQKIIEPFAGGAAYGCFWHSLDVRVNDLDSTVAAAWQWLITASSEDISGLPLDTAAIQQLPDPQRFIVGAWLRHSCTSKQALKAMPSGWALSGARPGSFWGPVVREYVAMSARRIKHWQASNLSYEELGDPEVTWFVDPPYSGNAGRSYVHNKVDYDHLADWCRTRRGQVIVCEAVGADGKIPTWLPFTPLTHGVRTHNSYAKNSECKELVWTNVC